MSNLAKIDVYLPQLLSFELQHFRQESVCWLSGPYQTRKIKWSQTHPLTFRPNKIQFEENLVEKGSSFYKTMSNPNQHAFNQRASVWHIYLRHWIVGAMVGFKNAIRLRGVGYRFEITPLKMTIQVGYSHAITKKLPLPQFLQSAGVNRKSTLLRFKSTNLTFLQTFLSNVRLSRPPDIYKGKGIRYQKDFVFRKEGKKKKTN